MGSSLLLPRIQTATAVASGLAVCLACGACMPSVCHACASLANCFCSCWRAALLIGLPFGLPGGVRTLCALPRSLATGLPGVRALVRALSNGLPGSPCALDLDPAGWWPLSLSTNTPCGQCGCQLQLALASSSS